MYSVISLPFDTNEVKYDFCIGRVNDPRADCPGGLADTLIRIDFFRFYFSMLSLVLHVVSATKICQTHFQTPPLCIIFFTSLLFVWKCGQMWSFVFDLFSQILLGLYMFLYL